MAKDQMAAKTGKRGRRRGRKATARDDAGAKARTAMNGAYEWAQRAGQYLPHAGDWHMPDARRVEVLVEERPLLLGAISLGLGLMIGALMPSYASSRMAEGAGPRRSGQPATRH